MRVCLVEKNSKAHPKMQSLMQAGFENQCFTLCKTVTSLLLPGEQDKNISSSFLIFLPFYLKFSSFSSSFWSSGWAKRTKMIFPRKTNIILYASFVLCAYFQLAKYRITYWINFPIILMEILTWIDYRQAKYSTQNLSRPIISHLQIQSLNSKFFQRMCCLHSSAVLIKSLKLHTYEC